MRDILIGDWSRELAAELGRESLCEVCPEGCFFRLKNWFKKKNLKKLKKFKKIKEIKIFV